MKAVKGDSSPDAVAPEPAKVPTAKLATSRSAVQEEPPIPKARPKPTPSGEPTPRILFKETSDPTSGAASSGHKSRSRATTTPDWGGDSPAEPKEEQVPDIDALTLDDKRRAEKGIKDQKIVKTETDNPPWTAKLDKEWRNLPETEEGGGAGAAGSADMQDEEPQAT